MKKKKKVVKVSRRTSGIGSKTAVKPKTPAPKAKPEAAPAIVVVPDAEPVFAAVVPRCNCSYCNGRRESDTPVVAVQLTPRGDAPGDGQTPLTYAITDASLYSPAPEGWGATEGCSCRWCVETLAAAQLPPPVEAPKAADSTPGLDSTALVPQDCTRPDHHDGPCNGLARSTCEPLPEYFHPLPARKPWYERCYDWLGKCLS